MHCRPLSLLLLLTGVAWLTVPSASGEAGDWMFRRSYYSHDAGPGYNPGWGSSHGPGYSRESAAGEMDDWGASRTVNRDPWVGAHPHSAVRSGWRYNSFVIHSGSSTDTTIFRENWYDKDY